MDRAARRAYIERLFTAADKMARRMNARFVVDRRRLRAFAAMLRARAALATEARDGG